MLIGTNKEKLHEHYFVFPFRCAKCGNLFMLERGLRRRTIGYEFGDCWFSIEKYKKYCGICSQEIAKKPENFE